MVVAGADIAEYPVNVVVYSEYEPAGDPSDAAATSSTFSPSSAETPTELTISDKAEELEIGKLTKVGVFNAIHRAHLLNFETSQTSRENPWVPRRRGDHVTTVMSAFK